MLLDRLPAEHRRRLPAYVATSMMVPIEASGLAVGENPTPHLEVPVADGKRDRIASPDEAAALLAALPKANLGAAGGCGRSRCTSAATRSPRWASPPG